MQTNMYVVVGETLWCKPGDVNVRTEQWLVRAFLSASKAGEYAMECQGRANEITEDFVNESDDDFARVTTNEYDPKMCVGVFNVTVYSVVAVPMDGCIADMRRVRVDGF